MALPAFVTTLLAISSLALAAPSDSLAHRDTTPTIKSQVWAGGKTYYYRGCYDELKSGMTALSHDLSGSLTGPVTVESCVSTCASHGYQIAGVMYGNMCHCDNALSAASPKLDDSQCSNPCAGNASELCGGVWHYDIYYTKKVGPIPAPSTPLSVGSGDGKYLSIGCWKDNVSSRTLDGAYYRGDDVTPAQCAAYCHSQNFRIAGVEFGMECFCGQELFNPDYAPSSDCDEACAGDSTLTCGMEDRLNVYVGVDTPDVLRPKVLAGTTVLNQYISLGCYSDSYDSRALTGYNTTASDMTADSCAATCYDKGFVYAGLELGNQCWCGQDLPDNDQVDASRCDTACAGDSAHSCGGGLRLDVYKSLLLGWL